MTNILYSAIKKLIDIIIVITYDQYYLCHHSKDVRLPIQLQRAMAAEAEATREAKAKVLEAGCMDDG